MAHSPQNNWLNCLTIYGRKSCEEALQDKSLSIQKLHLADSNKPAAILEHCESLANQRNIPIEYHSKRELSFISKSSKQDQGIALDIYSPKLKTLADLNTGNARHILLLDNITNPQNIGMIIRSAAAGFLDGIVIPEKGCAALGPLVIKASAGTVFKAPIFRCKTTEQALESIKGQYCIASLDLKADKQLYDLELNEPTCFVLGNETHGVSTATQNAAELPVKIPMNNDV